MHHHDQHMIDRSPAANSRARIGISAPDRTRARPPPPPLAEFVLGTATTSRPQRQLVDRDHAGTAPVVAPGTPSAAPRAGPPHRATRPPAPPRQLTSTAASRSGCCTPRSGSKLRQEPQPLLRERQRHHAPALAAPRHGPARTTGPGRPAAASHRDVGAVEQRPQRNLDAQHRPDPVHQPGGQQRMPTQLEETVVDTDPLDTQHLGEQTAQHLLHAASTGHDHPTTGRYSGAGNAARSSFPFTVNGNASSSTNADGTMYSGNRSPDNRPHHPATASPPTGTTYATNRLSPAVLTDHHRLATTAAAPANTASTSPGSTRNPRIFTCSSARPRTPTHHPRPPHQIPRAIHPLTHTKRTATNRSAVNPADPDNPAPTCSTRHIQLTHHTQRHRPQDNHPAHTPAYSHRPPDRHAPTHPTPQPASRHHHRRLRRPIRIHQPPTDPPTTRANSTTTASRTHHHRPHTPGLAPDPTQPTTTAPHSPTPPHDPTPTRPTTPIPTLHPDATTNRPPHINATTTSTHRRIKPNDANCNTPHPGTHPIHRTQHQPPDSPNAACDTTTPFGTPVDPDV